MTPFYAHKYAHLSLPWKQDKHHFVFVHILNVPYLLEIIPHPKISNLFLLPRTTPYMYALWCMHYVFDACNPTFTVFYGQILVLFGINCIPQGTIELILRDDFRQVRYVSCVHTDT